MPAPIQNGSALKHGLSSRYALTIGQMPKRFIRVQRAVCIFRRHLEEAVTMVHQRIGPYEASLINSASLWQRHALLSNRWLMSSLDDLTASEKVHYSREVARASSERDRCLRALGLSRDGGDTIDALYSVPLLDGDGPSTGSSSSAADALPDDPSSQADPTRDDPSPDVETQTITTKQQTD